MERPPSNPESMAEFYKIKPERGTSNTLRDSYVAGHFLKWSLDRHTFTIKLWDAKEGLHVEIDPEGFSDSTSGSIDIKHGFFCSDSRVFSPDEMAAIKLALEKFLTGK